MSFLVFILKRIGQRWLEEDCCRVTAIAESAGVTPRKGALGSEKSAGGCGPVEALTVCVDGLRLSGVGANLLSNEHAGEDNGGLAV